MSNMKNAVYDFAERSVLCWLATVSDDLQPNVSPKEMFVLHDENTLLIANIASPISVRNILRNKKVSVSMVDIFAQKGFKIYGTAEILEKDHVMYLEREKILTDKYSSKFPIKSIIEVTITRIFPILAPSYLLFPDTTEEMQIESATRRYEEVKSGNSHGDQ
jgi:uncharacterized protein